MIINLSDYAMNVRDPHPLAPRNKDGSAKRQSIPPKWVMQNNGNVYPLHEFAPGWFTNLKVQQEPGGGAQP